MAWKQVTVPNVALALGYRPETVYGWLAGDDPENTKVVKAALIGIYGGEPPASLDQQSAAH